MDLDGALRCLADADAGRPCAQWPDGRYVLVGYDPSAYDDEPADGDVGAPLVFEASSLHGAFDHLAALLVEQLGEDDEYERWLAPEQHRYVASLREIRSPARRILAYYLLGLCHYRAGPMEIVTRDRWRDAYLGFAPQLFDGARFVFLISAAPPGQDEAFCILRCQPTGSLTDAGRSLMAACRGEGDPAEIVEAVAAGVDVNTLDERGMTALHVAVAHRRPHAVDALLANGADPNLQAAYGNAPHFAGLDDDGRVAATARSIDDPAHWRALRALVEAGADVNAGNRSGDTLLDVAITTRPYPADAVRLIIARGGRSHRLAGASLSRLLRHLPYGRPAALATRANQVRYLLDAGADPNRPDEPDGKPPLHALFETYGYHEHEVPGEILLELVDNLLAHGARDRPATDGRTALDRAESWAQNLDHYRPVADRLRAAAST